MKLIHGFTLFLVLGTFSFTADAADYFTFNNLSIITDVTVPLEFTTYLLFSVEACNDATFHLTNVFGDYLSPSYHVALGTVGNTITTYRPCWNCNIEKQQTNKALVDCADTRSFYITWNAAKLKVGEGSVPGMNHFFEVDMDPAYVVKWIGFSTGNGAAGLWNIPEEYYLKLRTPSQTKFTNLGSIADITSMAFTLQSCNDAQVRIGQNRNIFQDKLYELHIDNNGVTSITNCTGCTPVVSVSTPNLLICQDEVPLWLNWTAEALSFGSGLTANQNMIINYTNPNPPTPQYMSVSGSPSSTAGWVVPRSRFDVDYDSSDGFHYYDIGWLKGETWVPFEVQGCSNALMVLGNQRDLTFSGASSYEFTIGGNFGTTCTINKCVQGNCNALNSVSCNPLSCTISQAFWVMWNEHAKTLSAGYGWYPGVDTIVIASDPTGLLPILYGGVSSGGGSDGVWRFPRPNNLMMNTIDKIEYQTVARSRGGSYFTFQGTAFADMLIALDVSVTNAQLIFQGYNIGIGTNSNTRTVIKRCNNNVCTGVNATIIEGIVDKQIPQKFWVSYAGGFIVVGTGWMQGANVIVSYQDDSPWTVNTIRVSTDTTSYGHWMFPNGACYRQVDLGEGVINPNLCPLQ